MFDYHLHSQFSPDSTMNLIQICDKAISLGLSEIAITDHMEFMNDDTKVDISSFTFDYNQYINTLNDIKNKYKGKINIKIGVELGGQTNCIAELDTYMKNKYFDFVILSEHYTNGDDVGLEEFFSIRTKQEAYLLYLDGLEYILNSFSQFCICGHLDFIARYGTYANKVMEYSEFKDSIDSILMKLISMGKGIEVNTSGYRQGLDTIMPNKEILKRYRELGGEILTIGSDAHFIEHIGYRFDDACEIIKDAGFKYLTVFEECKPSFVKI